MSKFFKALELAEREQGRPWDPEPRNGTPLAVEPRTPTAEPGQHSISQELNNSTDVHPRVLTAEPGKPAGGGSPAGVHSRQSRDGSQELFRRQERGRDPQTEPEFPVGIDRHLVSLLNPTGFAAEQYRALRHLVERWHKDAGLWILAVTSPAVGDGKTVTAINLAGSLAQAPEARVLLVDADLRRPAAARYLGLSDSGSAGLVDAILDQDLSLETVVRPCPPFNLTFLPPGRPPAAFYELLKSPRLGELLDETKQRYDYIVVDTPPAVPYPDCRLLGKWVDGFLFTVAAHKTPRRLLEEALHVVDPAKTLGLVFNNDECMTPGYYENNDSPDGNWTERLSRLFRNAYSTEG